MVLVFLYNCFLYNWVINKTVLGLSISQLLHSKEQRSWIQQTNCVRWLPKQQTNGNRHKSSTYITLSGRQNVVSDSLFDLFTWVVDFILDCASSLSVYFLQGKFIRINFDVAGYIVGANIETCILIPGLKVFSSSAVKLHYSPRLPTRILRLSFFFVALFGCS